MKLLLHTCCGPCTIVPLQRLRAEGNEITGFFFRHNIHPFGECRRREETLLAFAAAEKFPVIVTPGYDLEGFLRKIVFRETDRCRICFRERLEAAAYAAREGGFRAFSTTLLYSRYQPHEVIRDMGAAIGRAAGVSFLYRDFREGWAEGVAESRRRGMYRQNYCGCIYSERERNFSRTAKNETASPQIAASSGPPR